MSTQSRVILRTFLQGLGSARLLGKLQGIVYIDDIIIMIILQQLLGDIFSFVANSISTPNLGLNFCYSLVKLWFMSKNFFDNTVGTFIADRTVSCPILKSFQLFLSKTRRDGSRYSKWQIFSRFIHATWNDFFEKLWLIIIELFKA